MDILYNASLCTTIYIAISVIISHFINKLYKEDPIECRKLHNILNPKQEINFSYIKNQFIFILIGDLLFRTSLLLINNFIGYGIYVLSILSILHIVHLYKNYRKDNIIMKTTIENNKLNLNCKVQLLIRYIRLFLLNFVSGIFALTFGQIILCCSIPKLLCCLFINKFMKL